MSASLRAVAEEISATLAMVDIDRITEAAALIQDTPGAAHCTGQGRSGRVAAMTAMRLMHLGLRAHTVGEATAPAVTDQDLLLVVSASGTTPISLHYARIAADLGARILLVTSAPDSELYALATTAVGVPATRTRQLGGNLFEQCALITLDAIGAVIADTLPGAAQLLRSRHTNLQ